MQHDKTLDVRRFLTLDVAAVLAFATVVALLFGSAAFAVQNAQEKAAVEKSEVVYGMLNADGSLRDTYVVNRFMAQTPCTAEDFGAYSSVLNMSTTQELVCENDRVVFDMGVEPFFYQGTLEAAQLPWNIRIAYALDGREISPDTLAGSTGHLDITVNTSANPLSNRAFYDSFVLQITFTLDGARCTDIKAEGATLAASGENQTVAFTVLPGHDGSFKLSADVEDFEMPSAQIAALAYSSVIEMPDTDELESGLTSLADAISQLNQGTSELASGAAQLSSGADALSGGAKEYGDGLAQLASSSTQIVSASAQVNDVLAQIADALADVDLSDVDGLEQYAPLLRSIAGELEALKAAGQGLDYAYECMAAVMDYLASIVYDNALTDDEIATLRAAVADDEHGAALLERLLSAYFALQSAVDDYYANGGSPEVIVAQLEAFFADDGELDKAIDMLHAAADFLENGGVDQLKQLVEGLSALSSGYSQFHEGLVAYTQGVQALSENYGSLSSGVSQLADGTAQFSSGAHQLSSGVEQLNEATSTLPAQMRERISEMMADYDFPKFEPVSFVDRRNENVTAVQFVLLTDAIEKPEPAVAEAEPQPEPTMWDRLFALF